MCVPCCRFVKFLRPMKGTLVCMRPLYQRVRIVSPYPQLISPHTDRYLVPGLSFEGGIFKGQEMTFVWRLVLQ